MVIIILFIIDDYSTFTCIYLLKQKFEVSKVFLNFKAIVELQHNTKIKVVQSNGGSEIIALDKLFAPLGIVHRIFFPHTP